MYTLEDKLRMAWLLSLLGAGGVGFVMTVREYLRGKS